MNESPAALLLSDDLLDSSRVTGAARTHGLVVRHVRSVEALQSSFGPGVSCLILDLHFPGFDLDSFTEWRRSRPNPPRVIAFGSHVDAARLRAARGAGCDAVMPRSRFFQEVPVRVAEWLQNPSAADEQVGDATE